MKMKQVAIGILTGILVLGGVSGCGSSSQTTSSDAGKSEEAASDDAVRVLNGKIEIDEQLQAYAADYEERTGQKVVIESLGGGADIQGQIKNYNAAGNMPDIFVTVPSDLDQFGDLYMDLSDEEFTKATDMNMVDEEGKVVGAPYSVEGLGLVYNGDILEKAGIDPSSLTNVNAQQEAFEKLDGMKEELGLTSVVSAASESGQMWWSTSQHIITAYLSLGLERDDKSVTTLLQEGKIDDERMEQFAEYVGMLFDYSDEATLVSGTYDDQLALFAQGKTAFLTQGNWVDPSLPTYDATFPCGILPYAFLETDTPGVIVDSPSWWAVYKDSKHGDEAKAFLNDILLSDAGQKMFVEEAGAVSAYRDCKYVPSTPISADVFSKMQEGTTYSWGWLELPAGMAQNALGPVFELYAKDDINKDEFVQMMKQTIEDYEP